MGSLFFKGFGTASVRLNREAIVPHVVTVLLPLARMCSKVMFVLLATRDQPYAVILLDVLEPDC